MDNRVETKPTLNFMTLKAGVKIFTAPWGTEECREDGLFREQTVVTYTEPTITNAYGRKFVSFPFHEVSKKPVEQRLTGWVAKEASQKGFIEGNG